MDIQIETLKPILDEIREIVMPHFGNVEFERKDDDWGSPITELDMAVENHLKEALAKHYPDIEFVGEETGGDRSAKRKWLCDPIDGTSLFIRGIPYCTTMLAFIEDDVVQFGLIYNFVTNDLYWAKRGHGAFKNDQRLQVSDKTPDRSYIFWEANIDKEENQQRLMQLNKFGLMKLMCAGQEFALIAEGKIEGRVTFDAYGNDYDFAAGSLLIEEAGGIVTNIGSDTYDYRNTDFIAATPLLHKHLTEIL